MINNDTIHVILLITCVLAITIIVSIDLMQGGDGIALSSGLGAIGIVAGVTFGNVTNNKP